MPKLEITLEFLVQPTAIRLLLGRRVKTAIKQPSSMEQPLARTIVRSIQVLFIFFQRSTTNNVSTWAQQAYIKAPNAEAGDRFGSSVSIQGNTIVVGAPGEDSNQTTIINGTAASGNNSAADSGAAYVFKRTGSMWSQEAYLKASNTDAGDNYGAKVAINLDTIVVSADFESSNQTTITNGSSSSSDNSLTSSGAAYVYKRTGSTWAQEAYLKASNANAFDVFGSSVSLDVDTIVIGSIVESSNQQGVVNGSIIDTNNNSAPFAGAAYVFKRTGSTWVQEAYLKAANSQTNDFFGYSVSVAGDRIVVSAIGEDSNQTEVTDGESASSDDSLGGSGAVYVFQRAGNNWAQEAYIKAPNANANDAFGTNVTIDDDNIAIGASGEDSNIRAVTTGTTASSDNSAADSGAAYLFTF